MFTSSSCERAQPTPVHLYFPTGQLERKSTVSANEAYENRYFPAKSRLMSIKLHDVTSHETTFFSRRHEKQTSRDNRVRKVSDNGVDDSVSISDSEGVQSKNKF